MKITKIEINESRYPVVTWDNGEKEELALKAIGRKVIIKQNESETMTSGGVMIAPSDRDKRCSGIVLSIGKKVEDANEISVGDNVASDAVAPSTAALEPLTAARLSVCHSWRTPVAFVLPTDDINGVSVGEML